MAVPDPAASAKLCPSPSKSDLLVNQTRKTMAFAYGFMATFAVCIFVIVACDPTAQSYSSPWFKGVFRMKNTTSQFSSLFSNLFPNSSDSPIPDSLPPSSSSSSYADSNATGNRASASLPKRNSGLRKVLPINDTQSVIQVTAADNRSLKNSTVVVNQTVTDQIPKSPSVAVKKKKTGRNQSYDFESMSKCDLFNGKWIRDDSYPLYAPGSCPHIDEPFDCFRNGRPDNGYEKFRWQPNHCNVPRLKGKDMLELIRGKRLVFIGDSLNRNMWESLVCILKNSVEDKSRVFEASGRHEFRTEGSYSFIFKDYNCSVEFFRSPFLVQEWETPDNNGSKKETLRLDLVERSADRYKDADILVFNSGHWWTHEKTAKGLNYYQEGSHVYGNLNAAEAYRRAMTTWGRWVDANINPINTQVFFRGYSASHFRGGAWNAGGQCEKETEPFNDDTYLVDYPKKMKKFETVLKGMKTHVYYLNITKMTDYRKDAHPSVYRALHLTEEERLSPLRFQDCSHWCLPGVPDTWNEILYAQLLISHYKKHKQKTIT